MAARQDRLVEGADHQPGEPQEVLWVEEVQCAERLAEVRTAPAAAVVAVAGTMGHGHTSQPVQEVQSRILVLVEVRSPVLVREEARIPTLVREEVQSLIPVHGVARNPERAAGPFAAVQAGDYTAREEAASALGSGLEMGAQRTGLEAVEAVAGS